MQKGFLYIYDKLLDKGIIIDKNDKQKLIVSACELNNKSSKKFCPLCMTFIEEKSKMYLSQSPLKKIVF